MKNSVELKYKNKLKHILCLVKGLGFDITSDSMILEFGCGTGKIVNELRSFEKHAFGCDIKINDEKYVNTKAMYDEKIIRLIDVCPYKIPFDDNTFDFIFSDQVFEHVTNYSESISEIRRILKPGGFCLHIFPSRFKPIEAHIRVPFSSINNSYLWLFFWAKMGIRKKSQIGFSPHETAIENNEYLKKRTNYLSKKKILENFEKFFDDVKFCEELFLKYSKRGEMFYKIFQFAPFMFRFYSTFQNRVLIAKNPKKLASSGGDGSLGFCQRRLRRIGVVDNGSK
jgi:SAM-dependent methyltransferase